jgi:hypothetical protein
MRGDELKHFARLCMAVQLRFLKDRLAVEDYFEAAAGARDQRDVRIRMFSSNLGRQTGGPGFVVSKRAVFDCNGHLANSIQSQAKVGSSSVAS